jgi:hypothetical protein
MISDETVEKILTETLANPVEMLEALREKLQSEHMLKVTKAVMMKEFHGMAISAQEREAVASDKYQKAIDPGSHWRFTEPNRQTRGTTYD